MRRIFLFLFAIPLLFCSCKQESAEVTAPSDVERLLNCIPTDAISFIFTTEAKSGIKAFSKDTTTLHPYALLDLKEYNRSACVISFHFCGEIEELIALELKEFDSDSIKTVKDLRDRASNLGYQSRIVSVDSLPVPVLLMSRNESLINSSVRHLATGNSVKDVPGLKDVINSLNREPHFLLIENSECSKVWSYFGIDFELSSNRSVTGFLKTYCRWMAFLPSWGNFDVRTFAEEDPIYFCNVLEGDKLGETKLEMILPDSCSNVVSLQFASIQNYIHRYERYLDAHTQLNRYRMNTKAAREWVKGVDIKEIAVAKQGDSKILLVRTEGKRPMKSVDKAPEYIEALFGSIFSLNQIEVKPRFLGEWTVFGDAAVEDSLFCFEQRTSLMNVYRSKAVVWMDGSKFRVMNDNKLKYGK